MLQVTTVFYQEHEKHIHAVVDIDFYQDEEYAKTTRKICRNLERFRLTPQLLHYELANGFPSFSPFDPKDFGGYSYYEILDKIDLSELQEIACYCVEDSFIDVYCQFDLMNEKTKELFKETIKILADEAKASGKEFTVEV